MSLDAETLTGGAGDGALSPAEFRFFYDASPLLMGAVELLADGDIRHLYDNPAANRFFGLPAGGTSGRTARQMGVSESTIAVWRARYEEAGVRGQPVEFEYVHEASAGEGRVLAVTASPLPHRSGPRFSYVAEDVTARRRTEADLRLQEGRLELALQASRMGDWSWDAATGCVTFSARAAEIFGVAPGASIPWDEVVERIHPEDLPLARAAAATAMAGGAYEVEYRFRRPADGRTVWLGVRGRAVFDASGRAVGRVGMAWDQSRLKTIEDQLREEGRRAAELQRQQAFRLQLSDALRPLTDAQEILVTAAGMLGRFLGVQRVGFVGPTPEPGWFAAEANWAEGLEPLEGRIRPGDFGAEVARRLAEDRRVVVEDAAEPPWNAPDARAAFEGIGVRATVSLADVKDGAIRRIFYVHAADTRAWSEEELETIEQVASRSWAEAERARAEQALRDSEARFQAFMSHGLMAAWIIDEAGIIRYLSPGYFRTFGIDGDLVGRNIHEVYGPELAEAYLLNNRRALDEDRLLETVEPGVRRDGTPGEFLAFKFPLQVGGERLLAGLALDVTDNRRAEARLRASEERLRLATEGTGVGIYDLDLQTGVGAWTPRAFQVLGLEPTADGLGRLELWASALHPEERERIEAEHARARESGEGWRAEYRIRRHDTGEIRWLETLGAFVETDGRQRSVGVVADVTERKRLEEHQRLLIHELNHRVKNTLAIVQSFIRQTLANAGTDPGLIHSLEGRLAALAAAHDVLTREKWEGASLRQAIESSLSALAVGEGRARLSGPEVPLSPKSAVAIAMAVHELTTNAAKYGALSTGEGWVSVRWAVDEGRLRLEWREAGGPVVSPPAREGFGSRLVRRSLAAELGGEVELAFRPQGLVCRIDAPAP